MIKPRIILARTQDGKLSLLHLSEDAEAARKLYNDLRDGTGQGYSRIDLFGPYGNERGRNFDAAESAELRPAKAMKVKA